MRQHSARRFRVRIRIEATSRSTSLGQMARALETRAPVWASVSEKVWSAGRGRVDTRQIIYKMYRPDANQQRPNERRNPRINSQGGNIMSVSVHNIGYLKRSCNVTGFCKE